MFRIFVPHIMHATMSIKVKHNLFTHPVGDDTGINI